MTPPPQQLDYIDFAIHITPGPREAFGVIARATDSRGKVMGEAEGMLTLPFELHGLARSLPGVARSVRSTREIRRDGDEDDAVSSPGGDADQFGNDLFNALFNDKVRDLFSGTRGVLRVNRHVGIRIRLSVSTMADSGMAAIAAIPWELMTASKSEGPLALSRNTLFTRSLMVMHPSDALPFEAPLRILIVQSNPRNTSPLNLAEERRRIEETWGKEKGVELVFGPPIMSKLRTILAEQDFHVIHYMGHGEFNARTGRGALLLEDENGDKYSADAEEIGRLMDAEPKLRLVFLNACKSATATDTGIADPFGGVAQHLINRGVPAVIAMQFPISDAAATTFADTFYRRIIKRFPVDVAVTEARNELGNEWATPVLYMRSRDGVLFDALDAPSTREDAAVAGRPGASVAPKAFTVFLGRPDTPDDSIIDDAESALAGMGISVITSTATDEAEHAEQVRAITRTADLLVHFMGSTPGSVIPGSDARSYAIEELKLGHRSDKPQLILRPEGVEIDATAHPVYASYMSWLETAPRDRDGFEIVHGAKRDRLNAILEKVRQLRPAPAVAVTSTEGISTAYIEMFDVDGSLMPEVQKHFQRRSITPIFRLSSSDLPAATREDFHHKVNGSPLMIVVYGEVDRGWVKGRVEQAVLTSMEAENERLTIGVLSVDERSRDDLKFGKYAAVVKATRATISAALDELLERAREA